MSFYNLGKDKVVGAGSFQARYGARFMDTNAPPVSGTAGTGVDHNGVGPELGTLLIDNSTGNMFVNEDTTNASPYWTPISMTQPNIVGVRTDFAGAVGRLGTATTASSQDANVNGLRYFGHGVEENDANTAMTVSYPVDGPLLTMGTENQANFASALGHGHTTALWVPGTKGTLTIDVTFTAITDILTRSIFCGFTGESAEAMDPAVAGSTATLTFQATGTQGDNVHGLFMDSRLTAASTIYLPSVKANAAASVSTTTAALTVAATMPAAATYTRWRVEIATDGTIYAFVNKVLVKTVSAGASTTVALSPVFMQANTTTTGSLSLGVRKFGAWATRA